MFSPAVILLCHVVVSCDVSSYVIVDVVSFNTSAPDRGGSEGVLYWQGGVSPVYRALLRPWVHWLRILDDGLLSRDNSWTGRPGHYSGVSGYTLCYWFLSCYWFYRVLLGELSKCCFFRAVYKVRAGTRLEFRSVR